MSSDTAIEITEELKRFAETTTIKGVGRTLRARQRAVRVFWISALVSCLAVLLYQTATVVINYCRRDVIRNSGIVIEYPNFPDVTACNLFPVSDFRQMEHYEAYKKMVVAMRAHASDVYRGDDFSRTWNFLQSLYTFNVHTPVLDSVPVSGGLVADCKWYGWDMYSPQPCNITTRLVTPLQWCSVVSGGDPASTPRAALSLLLYTNSRSTGVVDSYKHWVRFPAVDGVRVTIHPRGTLPNYMTAMSASPGTETSFFISQTNSTRLGSPYGNCTNREHLDATQKVPILYDYSSCVDICRQNQLVTACGCVDNNALFTDDELRRSNSTFCYNVTQNLEPDADGALDRAEVDRRLRAVECMRDFKTDLKPCGCHQRCRSTDYETRVTAVKWPKLASHLKFYEMFIRNQSLYGDQFAVYESLFAALQKGNVTVEQSLESVRRLQLIEDNFLQVYVRFDQKSVRVVQEVPAISWDTMASNLGGSLNLWLGISVPTIAEIIELVYSLITVWLERKKNQKNSPPLEKCHQIC